MLTVKFSVSVLTDDVSFSLFVGDNDNQAYTRADKEIADPLRENENEEINDQPLIEAAHNIICDSTEAKLPDGWQW